MINQINGIDFDTYGKLREIQGAKIQKMEFSENNYFFSIQAEKWREEKVIRLWTPPDCCDYHYFTCDDDLSSFIGARIDEFEVRDQPNVVDDEEGEVHEVSFLIVTTSKGQFTVAAHNEHNGYYGGIYLQAEYV